MTPHRLSNHSKATLAPQTDLSSQALRFGSQRRRPRRWSGRTGRRAVAWDYHFWAPVRVWRMRTGISFTLSPGDRRRLEGAVRDRNAAQKHVWRAAIILLSADSVGTHEIMRRTGKSKTCVWRWQERFMEEGVDGLLRDKTRPSRIPPLGPEVVERVAALTLTDPPGETTHWTAAMMAAATGVSESAVGTKRLIPSTRYRRRRGHGLRPRRPRRRPVGRPADRRTPKRRGESQRRNRSR